MQSQHQRLLTRFSAAALLLATLTLAEPHATGQVLPGPINPTPSTPPRATVALDPVSGTTFTIPSTTDPLLSPIGASRTRKPEIPPVYTTIYDADRLLSDGTSLWVLDRKRNQVARLDPRTGMVLTAIAPPASGKCIISDFLLDGSDAVWIGCGGSLFRMLIATRTMERSVDVFANSSSTTMQRFTTTRMVFVGDKLVILGVGEGGTWEFSGMLLVYSPGTGAKQYFPLYAFSELSIGSQGITNRPQSYHYGSPIGLQVVDKDQVIVTYETGLTLLFRINAPQSVTTVVDPRTDGWVDTAYLDGVLWMLNRNTGQLHRMVVATNQALSTLPVGAGAKKLLHAGRTLWALLDDRLVAVNPFSNTKMRETAVGTGLSDFTFTGADVISLDKNGVLRRH